MGIHAISTDSLRRMNDSEGFEYDGLTCLLYPFEGVKLDVGKLAMWRIQTHATFGGTWLSDFVPNRLDGFIPEIGRPADAPEVPARPKPKRQQER